MKIKSMSQFCTLYSSAKMHRSERQNLRLKGCFKNGCKKATRVSFHILNLKYKKLITFKLEYRISN